MKRAIPEKTPVFVDGILNVFGVVGRRRRIKGRNVDTEDPL
jgi:hypothetical protein